MGMSKDVERMKAAEQRAQEFCGKSWGNDIECFSGVLMDCDMYYEGFPIDVTYQPCPCNPKFCKDCRGTGNATYDQVDGGVQIHTECDKCDGCGWLGEPELPPHMELEEKQNDR